MCATAKTGIVIIELSPPVSPPWPHSQLRMTGNVADKGIKESWPTRGTQAEWGRGTWYEWEEAGQFQTDENRTHNSIVQLIRYKEAIALKGR